MRIEAQLIAKPHAAQKLLALGHNLRVYLALVCAVVRPCLGLKLGSKRDVVQRRILREKVEILKNKAEMQPVAAYLLLAQRVLFRGEKYIFSNLDCA